MFNTDEWQVQLAGLLVWWLVRDFQVGWSQALPTTGCGDVLQVHSLGFGWLESTRREIWIDVVHWCVTLVSVIQSREVSTMWRSLCTVSYRQWSGTMAFCPHCGGFRNTGSPFSEGPLYMHIIILCTCTCSRGTVLYFACSACSLLALSLISLWIFISLTSSSALLLWVVTYIHA